MPLPAQPRPTVLLACTAQSLARLHPLLADAADVAATFSLEQATRRLAEEPALVVCNMKFDDSRMLDLAAEAAQSYPHIPFVCCRTSDSELSSASLHAAHAAASNLGVVDFLDLFEMDAELGEERAAERFKERIARLLSRPKPAPPTEKLANRVA